MRVTGALPQSRSHWFGIVLLLLGIVSIPLMYGGPLLGVGLDNLPMVRHFDHDEFSIYQAWRNVYLAGPLHADPFDPNHIYPKLFYNLAGVVLYPYTRLHGEQFQVTILVWRSLNLLGAMGALVMLFCVVRRVFRSTAVAALSGFLLSLTPDFLWWSVNSRPQPLEYLFLFACLYACVRLAEGWSPRWFWTAASLGAMAFATKYGGTVFLVLLPAVAVTLIAHGVRDPLPFHRRLGEHIRLFRRLSPWLLGVSAMLLGWLSVALASHRGDVAAVFLDWAGSAFAADSLSRVQTLLERERARINALVSLGSVAAVIGIAVCALVDRWVRSSSVNAMWRVRRLTYAVLFIVLMGYTAGVYVLALLLTGPAYVAHPSHLISQAGYMLYYIAFGAEYGAHGPPSFLESLSSVGAQFHPGWFAVVPLLGYAVYDHLRTPPARREAALVERRQRNILWAFAAMVTTVFLATRVIAFRHLLPAIAVLYAFIAEAALNLARRAARAWRPVAWTGCLGMLGVVLVCHGAVAMDQRRGKRWQDRDIGLQAGAWLADRYDWSTTIMTDYWPFYVPPQFTQATTIWEAFRSERRPDHWEEAAANLLVKADPAVLILTEPRHAKLPVHLETLIASHPTLQARSYHLVQRFDNRSRYGAYNTVCIYERGSVRRLAAQPGQPSSWP